MILLLLMCLVVIRIDLSLTDSVKDPRCEVNCSCCIDQICGRREFFNNTCIKGCIDGYRGDRCYIKCSDYCKACDSFNSNNCTKCYDGLYNGKYQNCSEKCDLNCKACAHSPDSCTKCHDGFYLGIYRNCSEECPPGCKACKSRFNCSECREGYYSGKEFDFDRSTTVYNCTYQCRETCTRCLSYNNCTGCVRGGYGTTCEKECSVGCLNNTCQQSTGNCSCKAKFKGEKCTHCAAGKFGKFCDSPCPLNCKNAICDKVSGHCSNGCMSDVFVGDSCKECITGKYGKFCNESCPPNCKGDKCNKMAGVCLNGCKENFAGDTCSTCTVGKYSPDCSVNCSSNCENQVCEFTSGNCFKCKDNFMGKKCDKCKIGFYGSRCSEQCPPNCLYDVCDRDTGSCLAGCKDTFSGNKCCVNNSHCFECSSNTDCSRCVVGFYTHNCLSICPKKCDGNPCELMNGTCIKEKETESVDTQRDNVTETRILAGFSISTVLLVACIVILVIILLKRPGICQRYRKQQNQADTYVENKVEMTEISASETTNITGCDWTSSSDKPYEELHVDETGAERKHQYLGIEIQNEDSTGKVQLYQNVSKTNERKIKLC